MGGSEKEEWLLGGAAQRTQGGRGGGNRKPHLDVALPRGDHTTALCFSNMRKDCHRRVLSLKSQQAVKKIKA